MADNNIEPVQRDIDKVVRNVRALSATEKEILYLSLHADRLRESYKVHRNPGFWKSPLGWLVGGIVVLLLCDVAVVGTHAAMTFGLFNVVVNVVPILLFFVAYFAVIYQALKRAPLALEKRANNLLAKREVDIDLPASESFKMAESVLATYKGARVSHVDAPTRCIDAIVTKKFANTGSHVTVRALAIDDTHSRLIITSESVYPQWDMFPSNISIAQSLMDELKKHADVHTLLLS